MPAQEGDGVSSEEEPDAGPTALAADELDRLIADYTDGQLDSSRARRLLELMDASPDARARLAEGVVVERLLRALGQGGSPTSRIMAAVHAEQHRTRPPLCPPAPRSVGRGRSLGWAGALLAVLAVFIAFHFRPRPPALVATPVPVVPPVPATPPIVPPVLPVAPAIPPVASAPAVAPAPAVFRPVFPFALPAAPPDVRPAPPGDGRGEPGFVAPPAEWSSARAGAAPGLTGDRKKPDPPLLWVSIQLDEAAAPAVADEFAGLAAAVQERLGLRYGWAVRRPADMQADPARNPVLFFTTHHRFAFTGAQRTLLRQYLLTGGMVVFNARAGSAPAYDSARRELRLILPELPLQRLGEDHPILHSYYNLNQLTPGAGARDGRPWLEGVAIACRTAALISRWDLAAGWAGHRADTAYVPEDALRLGINLSSYASAVRAWSRQAAAGAAYPDGAASDADRLFVAQVEYEGEWRTRYAAFPILLHSFNQRTEVPVKLGVRTMRLRDPRLFDAPLLYLTGHEPLVLAADEILALRRYLESGGFLFAEACCGRRSFDRSFRALMQQVLPDRPLEAISEDSALFQTPNRMAPLGVTASLAAKEKSMVMPPRLEGIRVGESYGVVYSPIGLAGAWEATPMPYADGYDDPAALKLGQNILFQAITQ